jgi:hypothetical protein
MPPTHTTHPDRGNVMGARRRGAAAGRHSHSDESVRITPSQAGQRRAGPQAFWRPFRFMLGSSREGNSLWTRLVTDAPV